MVLTRLPIDRDLLRTKFAVPQTGPSLIPRDALLARLDGALHTRLTLFSAPAGFGKTTLVSEWLNGQSSNANRQPAWLTLDAGDNDPTRFWRYVINACRAFQADLGDALDALRASPQAETRPALVALLNALSQLDGPCVLVLDDLHAVTSPVIHEAMVFWLEQLPAAMHVIALTREDPTWPLGRWRARSQLLELRAQDLRFTLPEAEAFASQTFSQPIPSDAIAQLDARLEGWPAGWRMAVTLAAHDPQSVTSLATAQLAPQHIVDFFVTEVLAAQPPDLQDFLLRTAFLNRLTGSLCDAVTARDDSQHVLTQLAKGNVFVQQLDADQGIVWFRYHALFAEALRQIARERLGTAALRQKLRRASEWFERNNDLPEAIDASVSAQDFAHAAELIERFLDRQRYGELTTLRRWLEPLPSDTLCDHPVLSFALSSAILYTSDRYAPATRARIEPLLAQAAQRWQDLGDVQRVGQVLAFRSVLMFWQGDYVQSVQLAREALALLPDHDAEWRGICLLQTTIDDLRAGRMADLPALATEARALCAASLNKHAALAALVSLIEISYWRGEFTQANLYGAQVLEEAALPEFAADRQAALVWLARIALERREWVAAEQHINQAIELGIPDEGPAWLQRAKLMQLHLLHARGERTQAHDALQRSVAGSTQLEALREALLLQAHLALADGDATQAHQALAGLRAAPARSRLGEEAESLLRGRLLIMQRKPPEALLLLTPWREDAQIHERERSQMELALVEALAHATDGDAARARLALAHALRIASREAIVLPFIEAGSALTAQLHEHVPSWRGAEIEFFARELLARIGDAGEPIVQSPDELLSAQEQRVLRLLVAGMTNADIARELTVSVNTVKTQTQSIYRKLNVNSRDEAREAARKLKLV